MCELDRLNQVMTDLNADVVEASSLVEGIRSACGDVLSPSLMWHLEQWSGTPNSSDAPILVEPLCDGVAPQIALEADRPAQMSRVFESCSIQEDGMFDGAEFLKTSGPYAGVVASRLFAELSSRGVSSSRAVNLAQWVAGISKGIRRNVYGDFASRLWRVPLQTGAVARMEQPSCTPIVVAEGDWVRWQDRQWHPMTESGVKSEAASLTDPSYVSGNTLMGAWQSAQEDCREAGKSVLLAVESELPMGGVRPLLWTLDGLAGYHPAMVVRLEGEGLPHELLPLGALPFRVVDVRSRLQNQQDGLFLLPESSAMWGEEAENEHHPSRLNAWLPGVRLYIESAGWRLSVYDEPSGQGSERDPAAVLAAIVSHHPQIESQGVILTVSDEVPTDHYVDWLVALNGITDRVWLDARSPEPVVVDP